MYNMYIYIYIHKTIYNHPYPQSYISLMRFMCSDPELYSRLRYISGQKPVLSSAYNDCQKQKQIRPCRDFFNAAHILRD